MYLWAAGKNKRKLVYHGPNICKHYSPVMFEKSHYGDLQRVQMPKNYYDSCQIDEASNVTESMSEKGLKASIVQSAVVILVLLRVLSH